MKILCVITRAEHGGAQAHVLDLVTNLPRRYQAIVAAGEPGFLLDECTHVGIPVRLVPGLVQPIRPFQDLRALCGLIALIRRERPDVVHAHTSKAGLLGRLAAHLTSTPVVFTAHTWSFAEGIPLLQRWISIPLERTTAALGGKIITVSGANREAARQASVGQDHNLIRIWNGIPDSPLRSQPGLRNGVTLITVARLTSQKDHRLLLQSLAGLRGMWRLQIVGDGPTRYALERLTAELGLSNRVEFLGDCGNVAELLSQADVFVLASKWEGLPISILEAMRTALPVIATNVGGVCEAVTHDVTGYLTGLNDSLQLRFRIQQLMESRELMYKMGQAGRKRYEQDFRVETMVQHTVEVYEEAVECRARMASRQRHSTALQAEPRQGVGDER